MSRIVRPGAVSITKGEEGASPGGNHPRPDNADPNPLWLSHAQQQILDQLRAGVLAGTGVLFLTGDVGTGKTFLSRALLHRLRADAIIATPMCSLDDPQDFWREVGGEWEIPGAPKTLEALYDGLAALRDGAASNKRAVLIIDEAQGLSRDLFAEIARLAVMAGEPGGPARLSILLVGQDDLGSILSRPENAELAKRVGARYVTEPLTAAEVREYVAHQLARAGRESAAFTSDGLRELAIATQGIPRLINMIVDLALLSSGGKGTATIGAEVVRGCVLRLGPSPGPVDHPRPLRATPTTWMTRPRPAHRALLCVLTLALVTVLAVYVYEVAWQRDPTRAVNTSGWPAAAFVPAPSVSSGSATPAEPPRASEPGRSAVPGPADGSVQRPVDPPSTAWPAAPPAVAARVTEPGPNAAVPGPADGSVQRPVDPPSTAQSAAPPPLVATRASEPGRSAAAPRPSGGSVQPAPVPAAPARPLPPPALEGTTARSESPAGAAPAAGNQVVTAPTSSGARRPLEAQAREETERFDPGSIIDWLLSEYPARRQ